MGKKLHLTAFLWLCAMLGAYAGPVSLEQAKAIAGRCGKRIDGVRRAQQAGEMQLAQVRKIQSDGAYEGLPLYYVFNRPQGGGFVIVSGDDRMRPVIAESDSGAFDAETTNPGLRWWLDAVAQSVEKITGSEEESPRYVRRAQVSTVEPLIKTQWGQNAPFNNKCPELNGTHCVTGCVATAMAQMCYFYGYPSSAKGEVSYSYTINFSDGTSKKMELSGDLSTFSFDYTKMKTNYDENETGEAADEVAELMYACGLASEMLYTTSTSGSNVKYKVLTENFGFDASCAWASRTDYSTENWENILLEELTSGRPVFYSGSDAEGNGHQFLCDGYDGEGKFHINWGWSGYEDGYFDLAAIEYSEGQDMVYNVKPNEGGESDALSYFTVDSLKLLVVNDDRTTQDLSLPYSIGLGSYVYVGVEKLACYWIGADVYAGVALYKGSESVNNQLHSLSMQPNYSSSFYFGYTFPSTLDEGVYTLRPVVGLSKTDYEPVKGAMSSSGSKYLIVAVQDGKVIFTDCMKTVPTSGYATFSAFCNVKLPEGLSAYKAKLNSDNSKVLLTKLKGDVIPANTGVVLYHKDGGKFLLDITEETATDDFSNNALVATTVQPTVPSEGTYYALRAKTDGFAIVQNGLELSVGKAYLMGNAASSAKTLSLTFDEDEADAIGEIRSTAPVDNGAYYTLQGIRVEHPSKGIYIHNGQKIFIK